METFLHAITAATDLSQEHKDFWREACRQHYLKQLLAFTRSKGLRLETMQQLCEGRSPEQLEYWCVQLKCMDIEVN